MPDSDSNQTRPATERVVDKGRRNFLLWIPLGVFAGFAATIATAAFRYLRPAKSVHEEMWSDVAPLAELKGEKPIMKDIVVEHQAGWAITLEEHSVYVLPHKGNQVLSNVCPHESCPVAWSTKDNQFLCGCHDSHFTSDGERLSGPALRGLDPLPTREQNGILQVKFQTYVNNTEERIVRE
jgi:Rieske Fe-S protein